MLKQIDKKPIKESIIALINELQSAYHDKLITDDSVEHYSAIALIRNILELMNNYNQGEGTSADKLPRSDRLRNKLTHFSFVISSDAVMNFIQHKLNKKFIDELRQEKLRLSDTSFEETDLYKSLNDYNTDSAIMETFVKENIGSYAFHCIDYLEKFINFTKANNQYAAQFVFEQFLDMIQQLRKAEPNLMLEKVTAQFNDQFFKDYKELLRNKSAHAGFINIEILQAQVATMNRVLEYLKAFFSSAPLQRFPKPKVTPSRQNVEAMQKLTETVDKTQATLLAMKKQALLDLLQKRTKPYQQQELLKKSRTDQPSSETVNELKPTSLVPVLSSLEESFDQAWFTDDEMNHLINHYFVNKANCRLIVGINIDQLEGETFHDNLLDTIKQMVELEATTEMRQDIIVVPINLGNRHWTALYIHFNSDDHGRTKPSIRYFDPFGADKMPDNLQTALRQVFPESTDTMVFPIRLQQDGYNCGPWVIAILDNLINSGVMPNEDFDINAAREDYRRILNSILERTAGDPIRKTKTEKEENTKKQQSTNNSLSMLQEYSSGSDCDESKEQKNAAKKKF